MIRDTGWERPPITAERCLETAAISASLFTVAMVVAPYLEM